MNDFETEEPTVVLVAETPEEKAWMALGRERAERKERNDETGG